MANILVVDDEDLLLNLIVDTLRVQRHDVLAVNNYSDAFELVKQFTFDLLLCDVNIGKASGFELQKQIEVIGKSVPMLFISGSLAFGGAMTGAANQITLLPKPFTPKELLAAVDKALQRTSEQSADTKAESNGGSKSAHQGNQN